MVYEKYALRTWKDRVDFINNGAQGDRRLLRGNAARRVS